MLHAAQATPTTAERVVTKAVEPVRRAEHDLRGHHAAVDETQPARTLAIGPRSTAVVRRGDQELRLPDGIPDPERRAAALGPTAPARLVQKGGT